MGRIIILLVMHTLADFFLQGNKLSALKALKIPYLLEQVGIYTVFFILLSPLLLGLTFLQGLVFSFINGVAHFAVDFVIGKFKMKYVNVDMDKYNSTVGLDHTLHIVILIATYVYLYPEAFNSLGYI